MKFLVTGGAGFIGSHIVERLLKDGHFVRVLDNLSSGKESNLTFTRNLPLTAYDLVKGDICDLSTCHRATVGIDYVIHQAALRSVPESLDDPYIYNEVNINGTVNMLQASLKNKVKRLIMASSCSVYGDALSFPQKETDEIRLISPYALTKLAGEHYCRIFSSNYGLETIALRYFNVFGPRQSADDEYSIVIPKFATCILNDQHPPVHGTGKQSRDFVYVGNVVQANVLAALTPSPRFPTKHSVLNVGTGKDHTILDLISLLNKITNKSIEPAFTPSRPGDVFKALADISKAGKELGYKPLTSFEEGLRNTVEWFAGSQQPDTAIASK